MLQSSMSGGDSGRECDLCVGTSNESLNTFYVEAWIEQSHEGDAGSLRGHVMSSPTH